MGCDFAGDIVGVGGGATTRHVGERVFGSLSPFGRDGALAAFVVVAADRVVPIPDGVAYEQAAALPIAAGTALQALVDAAGLGDPRVRGRPRPFLRCTPARPGGRRISISPTGSLPEYSPFHFGLSLLSVQKTGFSLRNRSMNHS